MPALQERLSADLKESMRAGDTTRRDEIRGLLAMLKTEQQAKLTRALARAGLILHGEDAVLSPEQQAEADRLRAQSGLTEDEERAILLQRVKQHQQSIDGFRKGNRPELVEREQAQLAIDQAYLPQQLDAAALDEAIRGAIAESGARGPRDQGRVMSLLSARLRGRADLKAVASSVQELLAEAARS